MGASSRSLWACSLRRSLARRRRGAPSRGSGILTPAAEASTPLWEAFRHGLRDLGYVEGQNIVLEYRFAAGQNERLPALAAELVQLPVDVMVTNSGPGAQAAKDATKTIPIVTTTSGHYVVASLARPGATSRG